MDKPRFTFSCKPYLHLSPILQGSVMPEGFLLNFIPLEVEEIFWRQLKHEEFDIAEMSLSSYVMARSRGDERFVAIPVFTLRIFRHSCIYVNVHKGIKKPEDLRGRKVGVPEYQMTACLWLRGLIQHEYGVHPREMEWRGGGQETPGREEKLKLTLPPDIRYEAIPNDKTLSGMLDSGEIDALFTARTPSCFANGSPNVKRMFGNFIEAEGDYFRKTSIFPIMHTIVLKREVYEKNRWLAMSLYKACDQAKNIVLKGLLQTGGAPLYSILPWGAWEAERTCEVLGDDWWPYGVAKNRPTLDALCQYSFEQGLSARLVSTDELFAVETFDEFKI
jgi:4,5-dihydroxyphthalate decarboxylase